MLAILQSLVFLLVVALAGYFATKKFREVYANIQLGKQGGSRTDHPAERVRNMLLLALGQKKMFRNLLPAVLHLFIYVAFLITQIELIEIFIDGATGIHRFFWNVVHLGSLYTFIIGFIEVLSVFAFVATLAFLARRNFLHIKRFESKDLNGFPRRDANYILMAEIVLIIGIFSMNTADMAMHNGEYGFPISGMLMPLLQGLPDTTLHIIERFGWWLHLLTVLGFLCYLPYSKHLHILLAFPNAYFGQLDGGKEKGAMRNMPQITNEIALMMDPQAAASAPPADPERFGAKEVTDLSWKSLLDAYTCTECGRCSAACPANQTGKLLSPRKIMMDTRDRANELGKLRREKGKDAEDGKSLLHDYISVEELRACTTCNACVEECPVSINPLNIILEMRRYLILEEANSPEEWNLMFNNIETNGAVWKMPASERTKWINEV